MGYEELLAKNLIKPFKAKDQQIKKQMELASRDLKVAKAMLGVNNDWTYSIAYNTILQAVRALMYKDLAFFCPELPARPAHLPERLIRHGFQSSLLIASGYSGGSGRKIH